MRASLSMGVSFHPRGTWYVGGGSYTENSDSWMKEGSSCGASLCEGFHAGDLEGGLLFVEPKRWGFWEICKVPCKRVSLYRGPVGELGGGSCAGTSKRKDKSIWVHFFNPEANKNLSLGAIWNFSKETGLSWLDLGPIFLEPEDINNIGLGATWNFSRVTGFTQIDMGQKGPVN